MGFGTGANGGFAPYSKPTYPNGLGMSDIQTGNSKPYLVLARKYRPQNFQDLIGQAAMVQTLKNGFASGRVAHAYMLTGIRGVGKTTTARILARALNYQTDQVDKPTTDLTHMGVHCEAIAQSRHMDVIEMDAASHTGIDDMREIIEAIKYPPNYARYKVYIIDEVHMLSKSAFNGLLKTLEEPPPYVKFIFATTEIRKVPITILSRCQRFDLRRIDDETMLAHLNAILTKEGYRADDEALRLIVRAGEGSVRDSLSILDQALATAQDMLDVALVSDMLGLVDRAKLFDLFELICSGDVENALEQTHELIAQGGDPLSIVVDLADFCHRLTRVKMAPGADQSASLTPLEKQMISKLAPKLAVRQLGRMWQMLLKGLQEVKQAPNPIQALDMIVVRLTHAADLPTPDEVIKQLQNANHLSVEVGQATEPSPQQVPVIQAIAHTVQQPVQQAPQLTQFSDVVALAGAKKDLAMKYALENDMHCVKMGDGHLEIALTDGADPKLITKLGARLEAWTSQRWIVAISDQQRGRTVAQARAEKAEMLQKKIAQSDAMAEVLKHFPDAKITKVTPNEHEVGTGVKHMIKDI